MIGVIAPDFRAEYVPDFQEMERRLVALRTRPARWLWTDEIPGATSPRGSGPAEELTRFHRDPLVDPPRPTLVLYTAIPKPPR